MLKCLIDHDENLNGAYSNVEHDARIFDNLAQTNKHTHAVQCKLKIEMREASNSKCASESLIVT